MDKIMMPKFIQRTLPLALLVGGIVGAWAWLMVKRNKTDSAER